VCNSGAGEMFHGLFENARPTTICGGANSRTDWLSQGADESEQTFVAFEGLYLDQLVRKIAALSL
jgi:hypothetical protein